MDDQNGGRHLRMAEDGGPAGRRRWDEGDVGFGWSWDPHPPVLVAEPVPAPDPLVHQLRLLYSAEVMLATELPILFRRTNWLPLRLLVSDQRRETNRHIERLVCLLPPVDGLVSAPIVVARPDRSGSVQGFAPPATIIAGPLRAARAAITAYGTAIGTAKERGLDYAVSLLESSLVEEGNTARQLAALALEVGES